jgi:hypothetical protein
MTFIHDDPQFDVLLRVTAERRGIAVSLVEKDYWVAHCLWALHAQGFELWFKGGTSLSKGFGLIERFSEDLDLKLEPGRVGGLPAITNWKSDNKGPLLSRQAYYQKLGASLQVPGVAAVEVDPTSAEQKWRGARIQVHYPGRFHDELDAVLLPYVLLEVGRARVTPWVPRALSSFVHDELVRQNQLDNYDDNRPQTVRCVHPLVTLLEKLDALQKRVHEARTVPACFVRHFEDAAHIIAAAERGELPPLAKYASARALAEEMYVGLDIARLPAAHDAAFAPVNGARWDAIRDAHQAIAPMFWGPHLTLEACCDRVQGWLRAELAS